MARLFTYTIPVDDGAAPNPFHGMCSLAICKPSIRRVAQVGDWVAGLGSVNAPSGNLSGKLVYAMLVEETITLAQYDRRAAAEWPQRVPNISSRDLADRLGDCIYDYSGGKTPVQRPSVHVQANRDSDLGGENVLLSRDFYYFGSRAIALPAVLLPICHQGQGHKSHANAQHFATFVGWLRGLDLDVGQIHGWPDAIVDWSRVRFGGQGSGARALERADDPTC